MAGYSLHRLICRHWQGVSQEESHHAVRKPDDTLRLIQALTPLCSSPDKNPGVKNIEERFARMGVIAKILRNKEDRER